MKVNFQLGKSFPPILGKVVIPELSRYEKMNRLSATFFLLFNANLYLKNSRTDMPAKRR
jgi:hypothetical protein